MLSTATVVRVYRYLTCLQYKPRLKGKLPATSGFSDVPNPVCDSKPEQTPTAQADWPRANRVRPNGRRTRRRRAPQDDVANRPRRQERAHHHILVHLHGNRNDQLERKPAILRHLSQAQGEMRQEASVRELRAGAHRVHIPCAG